MRGTRERWSDGCLTCTHEECCRHSQGASNDGGPTAVGHPAGRAIEVCDIITAAIKRRNRKQANLRVRDEEDVRQRQMETHSHGDFDSSHPDGLDGAAPESLN